MRAYLLPEIEEKFATTLTDLDNKKFTTSAGSMPDTIRLTCAKSKDFYYKDIIKKEQIVIHFTVGTLMSDITQLTKPDTHVSVPYLIARNGTVYELFDPKCWAYTLGINATGGNKVRSQKTINIELSNLGPLSISKTDPNILVDSYNKPYCTLSDNKYYVKSKYRDYEYFATFTNEQYSSLNKLLRNLCEEFDIEHSFLPEAERPKHFTKIPPAGIVSHANYRKDKSDIGPAFLFSEVL